MNVLCDEGVDSQIVAQLREDGHDALYVAEMEPCISDDVVLRRANEHRALLITEERFWGIGLSPALSPSGCRAGATAWPFFGG